MFLTKKRRYHETIHDDTIGMKETICDGARGMKSGFVGQRLLKQHRNCASGWSFRSSKQHRCLLISLPRSPSQNECETNLSRAQMFANRITWRKSPSLQPRWAQQIYVTKEKNYYSECYKKVLHAGPKSTRNSLTNLSPNQARNLALS